MAYKNYSANRERVAQPVIGFTIATEDTNKAVTSVSVTVSEVLIVAAPGNAGVSWVNFGAAAVEYTGGIPMSAKDSLRVPLEDLSDINVLMKSADDVVSVLYLK